MMQGQPQPIGQSARPAQPQQPPREGMKGIDNATGRPVVVRNGQVVFADQPPPPAFNTVRGAPPGVMSNQLGREDEILQGAADERQRLSSASQNANRFGALQETQKTGGMLGFEWWRAIRTPFDTELSEMERINATLAPLQRQAGSGAMSDKDLAVFQRSIVSVVHAPEANKSYIAITNAAARRAADYESFMQEYRAMYGPGSLADGQRLWRQYSSQERLFNDDGSPRQNVRSWREFFGMEGAAGGQQEIPLSDTITSNVRIAQQSAPSPIAGSRYTLTPAAQNAYQRLPGGGFNADAPAGSIQRPFFLGPVPEDQLFVGQYGITPDGRLVQGQRPMPTQQPSQGAQQPAGGQQPVRITGDADYNRLPSGARFIGPDGVERVKP